MLVRICLVIYLVLVPHGLSAQEDADELNERSVLLSLVSAIVGVVPPALLQDRPLLIDLRSFVCAIGQLSESDVDAEDIRAAVGRPVIDTPIDSAIVRRSEYRIELIQDGVHVRLDGLSRVGSGHSALLTYMYTDRRGESSAIGLTQVYVTFERRNGAWEHGHVLVLVTS